MRSLVLFICAVIFITPQVQAQSPEYEALQKQIAKDFGISPTSMKITIEIEGDTQEGGPVETVKPEVEVKKADKVGDPIGIKMDAATGLPVYTMSSRVYTAPVVTRYYSAPVVTRYYSAPVYTAPVITRYYAASVVRSPVQTVQRTYSGLFGTRVYQSTPYGNATAYNGLFGSCQSCNNGGTCTRTYSSPFGAYRSCTNCR
jgi:hypothetical protein